ncbi:MAG: hypothetical protein JXB15_12765 [Anaerolineales bacterium]|nr:hypothetical protein [Anaerolineales bacterium]
MTLLGFDLGTTHLKLGLFGLDGRQLYLASRPNPASRHAQGYACYHPQEAWRQVQSLLDEALGWLEAQGGEAVRAIGVASMAETGLLLDRRSGQERTPLLPWFDPLASAQADELRQRFDLRERFLATGLRASFKCPLAKLLWLRENDPQALEGAIWLSAADYIAYRLCGEMGTDASLASRSCAFRIYEKHWEAELLSALGLPPDLFPVAQPAGQPLGGLRAEWARASLPAGTPVAVCGHDHVCAAFAAQTLLAGQTDQTRKVSQTFRVSFDSMGTAESLLGSLPARPLGQAEWRSGFSFGCFVRPGEMYWASGLSTSGGALEWLRGLLGDPPLSYAQLDALLDGSPPAPGEIIFLPYLAGRGAPHNDPAAHGSFHGLSAAHGRADLYRAVLEGAAYEMEFARRRAVALTGQPIQQLAAAGGGTRNPRWLQIKADVSGCRVAVLPEAQAAALGAALLAGLGSGVYPHYESCTAQVRRPSQVEYLPDPQRRAAYAAMYARFEALIADPAGAAP